MIIYCSCCGKQAVNRIIDRGDYITTLIGAVVSTVHNECICGYCAADLDENGLFPEERY